MTLFDRVRAEFNLPADQEVWQEGGYVYFRVGAENDVTGYTCQIDPDSFASRTIGNSEGCFWTDWQ